MKAIQPDIDAMLSPVICVRSKCQVTIETYTGLHDLIKEGPVAMIIGKLDSVNRCMALSGKDIILTFSMEQEDFLGRRVTAVPGDSGPYIFHAK